MRALASFLRNSLLCSSLRVLGVVSLRVARWILAATRVWVSFFFFPTGKGGSSFSKPRSRIPHLHSDWVSLDQSQCVGPC